MTEPAPEPLLPDDEPAELEGGFSRRVLGWIVGSVVVSFLASVLLGVYGRDLDRAPRPDANTFSYSALGHRALADFLRSMGLGVISRQSPMGGGLGPKHPLILAEPPEMSDLKDLRRDAGNLGAPVVVVLPKWKAGFPDKKKPEWLSEVELRDADHVEWLAGRLQKEENGGRGSRDARPRIEIARYKGGLTCSPGEGLSRPDLKVEADPVQLLKPNPRLTPVLACPGGALIAKLAGDDEAPTYLVADPDILNNQGLGRGDNASAIYDFLTWDLGATGVVFDETIHGFSRPSGLIAEALRFPMVLAVLQSLVLLGTVLWAGMGRFGKPLPSAAGLAAGKEILIDNTAKLLATGGHAADSLMSYFRQTTRAVAAHYFLAPDLPESERLARLQRLTERRGSRLSLAELEGRIHAVAPGRHGTEEAVRIARQLHDWRTEMTNGHREGS